MLAPVCGAVEGAAFGEGMLLAEIIGPGAGTLSISCRARSLNFLVQDFGIYWTLTK